MNRLFVGLTVCLAIGVSTSAAAQPRADTRPNILLMIADDWNWNHAGVYGCTWIRTPTFDRVAREGLLVRNCFTSNPKCSPCRASILTGRNTWQLEEASCHYGIFPAKFAVYPDLLEAAGYFVGFTGKGWGPGDFEAGGFSRNPAGPAFQRHKLQPPRPGISNNDYAANFAEFLKQKPKDKPFCFWLGSFEPHRAYDRDCGIRSGKKPADVEVPAYLPDDDVVRRDLLDYAVEVEWADAQFGKALQVLEEFGELDRTIVIITSDHGMPFPRVKGQIYEDGFHLPMAIRWGERIRPGRVIDDFVNVRDLAPTFLEAAGLPIHPQMTGNSLMPLLVPERSGWIDPQRKVMLVGKERHDLGRPYDWGYPVRAIRTPEFLLVHNYHPERWPAGNPETGYGNCDDGPTKTLLIERQDRYYEMAFGKRPEFELYRVSEDPECVVNLADDPKWKEVRQQLLEQMETLLRQEQDPRVLGNAAVFDTYRYVGPRQAKGYDEWLIRQGKPPLGHP
ncbi:MAG: heparan N-sulfatase [Pirellulaceae bacterium]|nr:MAG: heparan N-sulfatase [Pirellulaceae bacterium]